MKNSDKSDMNKSDVNKFDEEEKIIYDSLNKILVDKEKMMDIKNNNTKKSATTRRIKPAFALATIISVSLLFTITVTALSKFDWFIEKFNPSYKDILEPVGLSSIDKDIKMEIIAAQKYDNMAIVYLSLQDLSGQNRITPKTEFRDGFDVKTTIKEDNRSNGADTIYMGGFSWRDDLIYFDDESNIAYYEFKITTDASLPLTDTLQLGTTLIYFDTELYENESILLDSSKFETENFTKVTGEYLMGGSNLGSEYFDDYENEFSILTPRYYSAMPHNQDDQWISNIGFIDGKLHVQTVRGWHRNFGSSDASFSLISDNGDIIESEYSKTFSADGNKFFKRDDKEAFGETAVKHTEFVFDINEENINNYKLGYTGSVSTGVEGSWRIATQLGDDENQMIIFQNDIVLGDIVFEYFMINPLGAQAIGISENQNREVPEISLSIETADGIIDLLSGGGSRNHESKVFDISWDSEKLLNTSEITAVIIDGERVPIEK